LHALRHQDGIAMSMVNGKKLDLPNAESISSSRPGVALLFLGLVMAFGLQLYTNFDSQKQTLNFFGTTLQLGEGDEGSQDLEAKEMNDDDDD
jgi:hypothetical protein